MSIANCLICVVPVGMLLIAVLAILRIEASPEAFNTWHPYVSMAGVIAVLSFCAIGFVCSMAVFAAGAFLARLFTEIQKGRASGYRFADEISASLASKYPHLSDQDCAEIVEGLRDVFLIAAAEATTLVLPSLAVADAWSALPSDSQRRKCLYLPGPCAVVQPGFVAEGHSCDALSTTWRLSCELEGIDQHFPDRLPRLFALDARLAIPGGSRYSIEAETYPAGDPLSPKELVKAITQRLDSLDAGDARRRATSLLARNIRVSLELERYPHDWSDQRLARLFDAIGAHDDLLIATFGDIATADVELARAKATPREPDPGCCAQSADAVGGAGARR